MVSVPLELRGGSPPKPPGMPWELSDTRRELSGVRGRGRASAGVQEDVAPGDVERDA